MCFNNTWKANAKIPAHDVAQFLQVSRCEVPVVPVTALDILIYTVQIQGVQV